MHTQKTQSGYVLLLSMILISIVGVVIGTTLLLIGVNSTKRSILQEESSIARVLADACAEYALDQLRQNYSYAGNESLNFTTGNCDILPVLQNGLVRTLQTRGMVDTASRQVAVEITGNSPQLTLGSWQEVADF